MNYAIIVAHAKDRVIGCDNQLPWHLPADLKHFKQLTLGKAVVMGRKTYESIGRPLPGRRIIVMSRDPELSIEGCDVVSSVAALAALLPDDAEVMIAGGGQIYRQFLPLASQLYVTKVDAVIEGDTQFPEYEQDWKLIESEMHPQDERHVYAMQFCHYERVL